MDWDVFKKIEPDELTSCCWNSKDKLIKAPNVVAFTKRFNHVNFWVQKSILLASTIKTRSDSLAHFIKIGKKLMDLNNLHAVMAIVSALQSAAIFRLQKTWNLVSKKEKTTYDKLADLFVENDNRQKLRDYMNNIKLPCIPYLGLYLSDLTYIDVAHPHSGGMESEPRRNQMNNILRIISELQQSQYDHIQYVEYVQNYLNSVRYIEELQKFVEDDNYRLSLKLEPTVQHSSLSSCLAPASDDDSTAPSSPNVKRNVESSDNSFLPQHRKTKSLGVGNHFKTSSKNFSESNLSSPQHVKTHSLKSNFMYSPNLEKGGSLPCRLTAPYTTGMRHLLDDSVLEESPCASSEGSLSGLGEEEENHGDNICSSIDPPLKRESIPNDFAKAEYNCEGYLRRKTLLKNGKRPTITSWTRYWVSLWCASLFYFTPKSLKSGVSREDFKQDPSKMNSIEGWMIIMGNGSSSVFEFQLTDPVRGNSYKFRTTTRASAIDWCHCLEKAAKIKTKPQNDLILFE